MIKTITCNTWNEFREFADSIDEAIAKDMNFGPIFRGHEVESWKLHPSLLRYFIENRFSEQEALALEDRAHEAFKYRSSLFLPLKVMLSTPEASNLWAIMQHHGAPTRLLDWTNSVYVAAYFACAGSLTQDGCIWYADTVAVNETNMFPKGWYTNEKFNETFFLPNNPHLLQFTTKPRSIDRINAQASIFSLSQNVMCDHGKRLEQSLEDTSHPLEKVIIRSSLKIPIMIKLRSMNISAYTLFPGLEGAAWSVKELIAFHNAGGRYYPVP
jgi:hypothetical protein